MADDRTDRYRPVFEPEDIFDRFVKNANATDLPTPRDDEPTSLVTGESSRSVRGGPPEWDHEVTVRAPSPLPPEITNADERAEPEVSVRGTLGLRAQVTKPDEDLAHKLAQDPRNDPTLTESGQKIMLLTRVKRPSELPPPIASTERSAAKRGVAMPTGEGWGPPETSAPQPSPRAPKPAPIRAPNTCESQKWDSVIAPKGLATQKLEALRVVPDVKAIAPKETTYVGEGIEDGQMPTRELDRILSDMAVLLRYGHATQVRARLDDLRRHYPEDLLLLRRLSEFHIEHDELEAALETLFALAGGLFERRNVEGMRQALEQVLLLDPHNGRAERLLGLLDQRPYEAGK